MVALHAARAFDGMHVDQESRRHDLVAMTVPTMSAMPAVFPTYRAEIDGGRVVACDNLLPNDALSKQRVGLTIRVGNEQAVAIERSAETTSRRRARDRVSAGAREQG